VSAQVTIGVVVRGGAGVTEGRETIVGLAGTVGTEVGSTRAQAVREAVQRMKARSARLTAM
jgi:hypothetical protein